MLSVFRQRHLVILWLAQVFSAIGDRLYEIAVVWIAVQLTGSEAGFVLAAQAASRLVFGLLGGVYADRLNRRTLMIVTDIARAIAILSLPIAASFADISLWHLTMVAVITGGLNAYFEPALIASLPHLTNSSRTLNALNGLIDITGRLARVIGPSLAGLLLALMPISHFFTIDAMTFVLSALALFILGKNFHWQPETAQKVQGVEGVFVDLREAWGYLRERPHALWVISAGSITNIVWGSVFIVGAALLSERRFEGNAGTYGLIVAAYGLGNVLSNLGVSNLEIRRRTRFVFAGKFVFGCGFLLLAFAPNLSAAMTLAAFAALGGPMMDLSLLLMIQNEFPSHAVGKVFSTRAMLSNAGYSLGLALAAPLYSLFSLSTGIILMSSVLLVMSLMGMMKFWQLEPKLQQAGHAYD